MLAWASIQDVPTVRQHALHVPAVEAWAVLDGGVTSLEGYGATSLPCGVRVVGFQALRLLIAELGLAGPVRPFDGETVLAPEELRSAHRAIGRSPDRPSSRPNCWRAATTRCCCGGWRPRSRSSAQAAAARSAR